MVETAVVESVETEPLSFLGQPRTVMAKQEFLRFFKRTKGVVAYACEKAQITTVTFYRWKNDDPAFAAALVEVTRTRNEDVEDILMGLVFMQKHAPSVHYYLDRKHPAYMPKSKTTQLNLNVEGRTLEDLMRDEAIKNLKTEGYANTDEGTDNGGSDSESDAEQQGDNRESVSDSE